METRLSVFITRELSFDKNGNNHISIRTIFIRNIEWIKGAEADQSEPRPFGNYDMGSFRHDPILFDVGAEWRFNRSDR